MRHIVIPLTALLATLHAADWAYWGGDAGGTKFSQLTQVTKENVAKLKPAWTYHTGEISDGKTIPVRTAFEATPILVDGVLYFTTPYNRLIALDGDTGKELWQFNPQLDLKQAHNLFIHRGAAYWQSNGKRRIFYGTLQGKLYSIDAATGKPDPQFGQSGFVDLRVGVADKYPDKSYGMTSPPAVYKNLLICGSITPDGEPHGPYGDVRAFDARTGKLVWTFHTVPRKGEYGADTWDSDGATERGAANAWSVLSVDLQRGIVYLPLTSPATDLYGGDRRGQGLFADSVVALNAATGKRIWHFQTIHHNLWDYDLPAQPVLVETVRNGRKIPAVAQVTKTGFMFLFDRRTGKPLFDVVERPVAASEVPGEQAWPTQPFPVKPPPFARQSMQRSELSTLTPELKAYCEKLAEGATFGGLYTPIGLKPTVLFPGTNGGTNWGGASFDPTTRTLYVNSMDAGMLFRMEKRPDGSEIPYRARGGGSPNSRFWDTNLYACQQPPWGSLTAIDIDKGEFRWRVTLGEYEALTAKGIAPTGTPNLGGSLVTAGGLLFIAATNDSKFRAFDKDSGKMLWQATLPASGHANPMTYRGKKTGKQLIVIASGGGNKYNSTYADELIAYSIP